MFRNETQISAVCRALLSLTPATAREIDQLWVDGRPTDYAVKVYRKGAPWSAYELEMLKLVMAVWNCSNTKVSLARILAGADAKFLAALGSLLTALASERGAVAIDQWLERYGEVV